VSIELIAALLTGAAAIIAFLLAYKKEDKGPRRLLLAVGFVFASGAGLLTLEEAHRKAAMESLPQELEREWVELLETPVIAVEFEMLAPDGWVTPSLIEVADGVRFHSDAKPLFAARKDFPKGEVNFGALFQPQNLLKGSRIGEPIATGKTKTAGDTRTLEEFKTFECVASDVTADTAASWDERKFKGVCSVAVRVKALDKIYLRTIGELRNVRMTVTTSLNAQCIGPCKIGPLASVKLLMRAGDGVQPIMIEISPALLLTRPSSLSETTRTATYEIGGRPLLELAKSRFMQSPRYRERERFQFTKGLLSELIRKTTTTTERRELLDIVWTTNPSPDEASLYRSMSPEKRAGSEIMRGPEWCGFGKESVCWHRFLIMGPSVPRSVESKQ